MPTRRLPSCPEGTDTTRRPRKCTPCRRTCITSPARITQRSGRITIPEVLTCTRRLSTGIQSRLRASLRPPRRPLSERGRQHPTQAAQAVQRTKLRPRRNKCTYKIRHPGTQCPLLCNRIVRSLTMTKRRRSRSLNSSVVSSNTSIRTSLVAASAARPSPHLLRRGNRLQLRRSLRRLWHQ